MASRTSEKFIDHPLFALADLALVALAGALWYIGPDLGGWPLILALLPWAFRLAYFRFPVQRTSLDPLMLLFLVSGGVGIWASYDPSAAWEKFWLILDGVLLYYAIAGQPRKNLWLVAAALGLFSFAIAGYFLLTHDFITDPAKFQSINQVGLALMRGRPELGTRQLHPNVAAGLMAITFPFAVGSTLRFWKKNQPLWLAAGVVVTFVILFSILLTTSRGTWVALTIGFGVWGVWGMSGLFSRTNSKQQVPIFLAIIIILLAGGLVFIFTYPGGVRVLAEQLPGPANSGSRIDLVNALILLIGDYPLTGGGLDGFPGLYSQYILLSPSFILAHGHNLLLDIALEQGVWGALVFILLVGFAGYEMLKGGLQNRWKDSTRATLLWAGLVSLVVLIVHGVADDVIYGSRAPLVLWIAPGFGYSVMRSWQRHQRKPNGEQRSSRKRRRRSTRNLGVYLSSGVIILLVIGLYGYLFRNQIQLLWQANLAAVEMAKIDLADWPTDQWDTGENAAALRPTADQFTRVLSLSPTNITAHYRLGLIAMLQRNYETAILHLEKAKLASQNHPGIHKSLSYSYVWAGRQEEASPLLATIPEAAEEMGIYIWWWKGQDRSDLSDRAAEALDLLTSNQ